MYIQADFVKIETGYTVILPVRKARCTRFDMLRYSPNPD
jgi:hypothetical protein